MEAQELKKIIKLLIKYEWVKFDCDLTKTHYEVQLESCGLNHRLYEILFDLRLEPLLEGKKYIEELYNMVKNKPCLKRLQELYLEKVYGIKPYYKRENYPSYYYEYDMDTQGYVGIPY